MQKMKHRDAEVLFQKLGNLWYVFSEINGNVIYSALPAGMTPHNTKLELYETIENHLAKISQLKRKNKINPESVA